MKKSNIAVLFAILMLGSLFADSPPAFPTTFYGYINTSSGTPIGQTLTASINGSSATFVVANTSLFSCSPLTCNYYIDATRPSGDTSSTLVAFSINSHNIANSTFSSGGVVRLDFLNVPGSYMACLQTLCSDGSCQATCPSPSPSPSGGGGNSGGGSTGGSGSASSTKATSNYSMDVGTGNPCQVTVTREMTSGTNQSVLTTTLDNVGGSSCNLENFTFSDTIPDSFPAINEITFNPAYTSRAGWQVTFNFPTFAGGESKTITYSVNSWVGSSKMKNFTVYEMTANKKSTAAPTQPASNTSTSTTEEQSAWIPTDWSKIFGQQQPVAPPAQPGVQPTAPKDNALTSLILTGLIVIVVLGGVGGLFLYLKGKNKRGL